MRLLMRGVFGAAVIVAALGGVGSPAKADKLRVGNPSAQAFPFIPFEVGVRKGIFAKNGVEVARVDLSGGAQLHH